MTCAPSATAICTAKKPTPPARAVHQHPVALADVERLGRAPGRRSARPAAAPRPRRRTATPACARGSAAARARARPPSPTGRRPGGRSRTPRRRARSRPPPGRPPRRRRRRPSPGRSGSGAGRRRRGSPSRIAMSTGLTPAACTRTRTVSGPTGGSGRSSRSGQDVVVAEPVVGTARSQRRPFTYRPKAFWISRRESRSARSCRLS